MIFCIAIKESELTSLNLRQNDLFSLPREQWATLGIALKESKLTSLDLERNNLSSLSAEQWPAFCTAIQESKLTSLNLASNDLSSLSSEQWATLGISLKQSKLTSLDLEQNGLSLSPEQWTAFCTAIQKSKLTSLNLASNDHLSSLSPEQWTAFGIALKESKVTSLNLIGNDLYTLSPEQWRAFCTVIKDSKLSFLNLECNNLSQLSPEQWTTFCISIKESKVTSLKVGENSFFRLSPEQLTVFCTAIPESKLTSLNLGWNRFPGDWQSIEQMFTDLLQDNFDLIIEGFTGRCDSPKLSSLLERNKRLKTISEEAKYVLSAPMDSQKVEDTLHALSNALEMLASYQTEKTEAWGHRLRNLKASLQFKIFEHNYICSLPAENTLTVEARRTAFLNELPTLFDEDLFIHLSTTDQKTFDGFLLGATGCKGGVERSLNAEERRLLLQYIILKHQEDHTVTSSIFTFFGATDASLPQLQHQNEIVNHAVTIQTAWDKMAPQLQQVVAEESFGDSVLTSLSKLIPSLKQTSNAAVLPRLINAVSKLDFSPKQGLIPGHIR